MSDMPRTDATLARMMKLERENESLRMVNALLKNRFDPAADRIDALEREVVALQVQLDASCNAEELRQEREARKKAEAEVAALRARAIDAWTCATQDVGDEFWSKTKAAIDAARRKA